MPESRVVQTVSGDVPVSSLGMVNAHAHVVHSFDAFDDDRYVDYRFDLTDTLSELDDFVRVGGGTVVELTPLGIGRSPRALEEAAKRSGAHVIAGTGIYHEPFHPPAIRDWDRDRIAEFFIQEITVGMDDTEIRAGIIGEIGTYSGEVSAREAEVFRAAGEAACSTGVAVSTHTYLGRNALAQIALLVSAGLSPGRVIIGHLDDLAPIDMDLCRAILQAGAVVQFDGFGCEYYSETLKAQMPTDEERLRALSQLSDDGWADSIVVGSDICRRFHLASHGGPGFIHLPSQVPIVAAHCGVDDDLMRRWLVDNPARLLSREVA